MAPPWSGQLPGIRWVSRGCAELVPAPHWLQSTGDLAPPYTLHWWQRSGKWAPVPHPSSTVELVLVVGVQVSQLREYECGRADATVGKVAQRVVSSGEQSLPFITSNAQESVSPGQHNRADPSGEGDGKKSNRVGDLALPLVCCEVTWMGVGGGVMPILLHS